MPQIRLPDDITILEVEPELCLVGFRTVHAASVDDSALAESFQSHHAKGEGPRKEEVQHPILHRAISCWRDPEINRQLARMYPDHGDHIAKVILTFGHGFRYMDPAQDRNPQHLRVLGDPLELVRATADVFSV